MAQRNGALARFAAVCSGFTPTAAHQRAGASRSPSAFVAGWDDRDVLDENASLPPALAARIPSREEVLNHEVSFDATRWRRETNELGLPGFEPRLGNEGVAELKRRDIMQLADGAISPASAVQLLYASMAWGLGRKARNLRQRLAGLQGEGTPERLVEAWTAVRDGRSPQECYEVLLTARGRGRIRWLGPAFATKYLYFATGLYRPPSCVILDAVVARRLRPLAWPGSPTYGWWPSTYGRYCHLMTQWAKTADPSDNQVFPDQIEKALFDYGGPGTA